MPGGTPASVFEGVRPLETELNTGLKCWAPALATVFEDLETA